MFSGIDCLEQEYRIELDKNAKPVVQPTRKVGLPLMDALKESLDNLVKSDIIEKVEGYSDRVIALVLAKIIQPRSTAPKSKRKRVNVLDSEHVAYSIEPDKENTRPPTKKACIRVEGGSSFG